jgi:hypothetical protein
MRSEFIYVATKLLLNSCIHQSIRQALHMAPALAKLVPQFTTYVKNEN